MVRRVALLVLASSSLSAVALVACVGDDPTPSNPSSEDAAVSTDAAIDVAPDASDDVGAPSEDASVDAGPESPYWIFMTSDTYDGAGVGGLAGADLKCQAIADAHDFPGSYKAWLSDSATHRTARIKGDGPWKRVDGTLVFEDLLHMSAGVPLASVDKTADNVSSNTSSFWSGSTRIGESRSDNCLDWTSNASSEKGETGDATSLEVTWDTKNATPCSDHVALVCLRAD